MKKKVISDTLDVDICALKQKAINRGMGYGKSLLSYAERKAGHEGCQNLTWECLAWNKRSQRFYQDFGAEVDAEWIKYRK